METIYLGKEKIIKCIFLVCLFMTVMPYMIQQRTPILSLIGKFYMPLFYLSIVLFINARLYKEKLALIWICLFIWMNLITFINSGDIMSTPTFAGFMITIVSCTYMIKVDKKFFLYAMTYYYTALVFFNTVTWRPNGAFINLDGQLSFFVGTKTSITYYQIAACCFSLVYYYVEKNKKKASLPLVLTIISVTVYDVLQNISTSKICLVVFVGLVLLDVFFRNISSLVLKSSFFIAIIANIAIVFFKFQYNFEYLLVDVLEEDLTLDGRQYIWDSVLQNVVNKPILGHGLKSGITFAIGNAPTINTSAHNQLLNWVFCFGIVGLIAMLIMAICVMTKYPVQDIRGRIVRIIFITLSAMWISEQMQIYQPYIQMTILMVNLNLYEMENKESIIMRYLYFGKDKKNRTVNISSHN